MKPIWCVQLTLAAIVFAAAPARADVPIGDAARAAVSGAVPVAQSVARSVAQSVSKAESSAHTAAHETVRVARAVSPPRARQLPEQFDIALAIENPMEPSGEPLTTPRDTPDYDRRGERSATPLEIAAWVPRVLFFPLYLVSEYIVRRPLEFATEWFERAHVMERLDAATSWDNDRAGILPRFRLQSAFAPAVGLTVFWDDMFVDRNDWAVGADSDFADNLTVDVITRYRLTELTTLRLRYQLEQRNDFVYFGTGVETTGDDEARFQRNKQMGILEADVDTTPRGFGLDSSFEVSRNRFACTSEDLDICGPDNTATSSDDLLPIDQAGSATFFTDGYDLARLKLAAHWDSRDPRPASGTGVRLDVFGRFGQGIGDASDERFIPYGGEGSLFWDFWNQRTLGLRVFTELTESLGDDEIPFAELITIGGIERMRGFFFARFHGESAVVATVDYRYPISSFFDGNIFFEVGNAFGDNLQDFEIQALRPSAGISLRTLGSRYQSVDVTIAVGGDPFSEGIAVESARISVGTNFGY
jgi:hypothetical protein